MAVIVLPEAVRASPGFGANESAGSEQATICVLVRSPIADDPRVRRHCEAFHRAGWTVIGVGLPGARSPAPEWRVITRDDLSAAVWPSAPNQGAPENQSPGEPPGLPRPKAKRRPTRVAIRRWMERNTPYLWRAVAAAVGHGRLASYRLRLLMVRLRPGTAHDIYWSHYTDVCDIHACASTAKAQVWM